MQPILGDIAMDASSIATTSALEPVTTYGLLSNSPSPAVAAPPPPQPSPPSAAAAAEVVVNYPCPEHPTMESSLYCRSCRTPVCLVCSVQSVHRQHDCCPLDEAAADARTAVCQLLAGVRQRVADYGRLADEWRVYREELERRRASVRADVDRRRLELHAAVDAWATAARRQLESAAGVEEQLVADRTDVVGVRMATGSATCRLTDAVLAKVDDRRLLTVGDRLVGDLGRLTREDVDALRLTRHVVFAFDVPVGGVANGDDACDRAVDPPSVELTRLFGVVHVDHDDKFRSNVRVEPVRWMTFVRSFDTRASRDNKAKSQEQQHPNSSRRGQYSSGGSRYDAASVAAATAASGPASVDLVVVADRQGDRISVYSSAGGERLLDVDVTVSGKPVSAVVSAAGDIVYSRGDKPTLCVFNGTTGRQRLIVKDPQLVKPGSLTTADQYIYVLDRERMDVVKIHGDLSRATSHVKARTVPIISYI